MIFSKILSNNKSGAEVTIFGEKQDIQIELEAIFYGLLKKKETAETLIKTVRKVSKDLEKELKDLEKELNNEQK